VPAITRPELLVLVAVLRHDRIRLELDDGETQPLAVHRPRHDAVPDLHELHAGDVVERRGSHRGQTYVIAIECAPDHRAAHRA
jgi:hypothetical protein